MKYAKLILITILLLCCFIISEAQNRLKSIVIEEVLTIEGIGENLRYQRSSVATDNEGNIYITDLEDYSIKKFNNVGELIKVAGKKGDEPGEFQGPNIIRYYRGKLYVSEVYRPGIQVFDEELNFKFKIPIRFTVTDFNIVSEDRIAVSTLRQEKSEADYIFCIYIYDREGNEKEEDKIIYSTEKKFSMMNTVSFDVYRKNYFLIAYDWIDRIERFYKSGRLVWIRDLLGKKKARTRREKHSKRLFGVYPIEAVYKSIALDRHGNVYILGGDLSENISRDVYVMSINGHHLTTFTLPEASRTIHFDKENFLYSRSEDGKTIKKYSLEYIYE